MRVLHRVLIFTACMLILCPAAALSPAAPGRYGRRNGGGRSCCDLQALRTSRISVTSGRVPSRTSGPHVPVPGLT
jgi:hypothetical protein